MFYEKNLYMVQLVYYLKCVSDLLPMGVTGSTETWLTELITQGIICCNSHVFR